MPRVGLGYDVHRLVAGRRLVLGGVQIPFAKGLLGHSDADVLLHAICDAILGAAALGDIGMHFPDSDARYRDIRSLELLAASGRKVLAAGFGIVNIDSVIVAQAPRLAPYREAMQRNIADALGMARSAVSVKMTTTEGLGLIGRGDGMTAMATAMIEAHGSSKDAG